MNMPNKVLKIFQANVWREGAVMDAALQLAREAGAAVVLLQEPWWDNDLSHTKTHPAYHTFKPQTNKRIRVLTFIRRDIKGYAIESPLGRDHLRVFLPDEGLTIINVYRPPGKGSQSQSHTDLLATCVRGRTIVAGDFNAISPMWQSWGEPRTGDLAVSDWAEEQGLAVVSPYDQPTHDRGNVLDLVFSNVIGAEAHIKDH